MKKFISGTSILIEENEKYYICIDNKRYRLQDNKSRNPFNYSRFTPYVGKEITIEGEILGYTGIILVNSLLTVNKEKI